MPRERLWLSINHIWFLICGSDSSSNHESNRHVRGHLCDWPPAVISPPSLDYRRGCLRLHTPSSVRFCWGRTAGLRSGSPSIPPSCRRDRQTLYLHSLHYVANLSFSQNLKSKLTCSVFAVPFTVALSSDVTGSGSTPVHHCNRVRGVSSRRSAAVNTQR